VLLAWMCSFGFVQIDFNGDYRRSLRKD